MNGNSRETGKLTPDGKPDPSVFSTDSNPEGIRVGTAIALMVRQTVRQKAQVLFRNFWGVNKRKDLLESLTVERFNDQYHEVNPHADSRYSFRPSDASVQYREWPSVIELCGAPPGNGLMEKRGGSLIDIDHDALQERMEAYFDRELDWDDYKRAQRALTQAQAGFKPRAARSKALAAEKFDRERIVRYALRPLDVQWCYYTAVNPIWNRARPGLWAQVWSGNTFLLTRFRAEKNPEGPPFYFTPCLSDDHLLAPDAVAIPFRLRAEKPDDDGHHGRIKAREDVPSGLPIANLSQRTRAYLKQLRIVDADNAPPFASLIWLNALALGYSPFYLRENADGVRRDWPHIPLPASKDALTDSAKLGGQVAALLNTEAGVKGVTAGAVRPELNVIGNITATKGKMVDPAQDLEIKVGWGHAGKGGAIMPGQGHLVQRDYSAEEHLAFKAGASSLGLTLEQVLAQLGEQTCDVYLNDRAYWKNIPLNVWNFYIGGYQVIKKWLSYREAKLAGRAITVEEARYVRDIARRLAAICLLHPQLDSNYAAVKSAAYGWPKLSSTSTTESN